MELGLVSCSSTFPKMVEAKHMLGQFCGEGLDPLVVA